MAASPPPLTAGDAAEETSWARTPRNPDGDATQPASSSPFRRPQPEPSLLSSLTFNLYPRQLLALANSLSSQGGSQTVGVGLRVKNSRSQITSAECSGKLNTPGPSLSRLYSLEMFQFLKKKKQFKNVYFVSHMYFPRPVFFSSGYVLLRAWGFPKVSPCSCPPGHVNRKSTSICPLGGDVA